MLRYEALLKHLREGELSEAFFPRCLIDNFSVCSPEFISFITPAHRRIWIKKVSVQVSGYKLCLINPSAIAEGKVNNHADSRLLFCFKTILSLHWKGGSGNCVGGDVDPAVLFI